jgi:hypothetical protein
LREGQRQQDEHGDHDTVSEDRNNKIHPGARFLQVKIPHLAVGEMRSYVFPRLPDRPAGFGRAPLARELPHSSTTSPSSSLYISSPFLRRAGCQHTAQACGAKCRLACGSRNLGERAAGESFISRTTGSFRRAVYARYGTIWFPVELLGHFWSAQARAHP